MILKCDVTAGMARIALWESYIVGRRKRIVGVDRVKARLDSRSLVLLLMGVPIFTDLGWIDAVGSISGIGRTTTRSNLMRWGLKYGDFSKAVSIGGRRARMREWCW